MDNKNSKKMSSSTQNFVKKAHQQLDQKFVFSPPPNLDPIQMDHILQNTMKFLNVEDLKSARLVSKMWAAEGGKVILLKSHLLPASPFTNKTTEGEFLKFLSLAKPKAMFKLYGKSTNILDILKKFPEMTDRVRELKFKSDFPYGMKNLAQAIEKLSHLEILETNHLTISMHNFEFDDDDDEVDWSSFLEKLAALKDIRLDMPLRSSHRDLMAHGPDLNVSKIVLNTPDLKTLNHLIAQELEWPLNHVVLKFRKPAQEQETNGNVVRKFFIKYTDTLKFVEIGVKMKFEKPWRLSKPTPWTDYGLIPLDLPLLETMIISGRDGHVWALLTIALRLPQLKKLILTRVPEYLEEKIWKWEKHPSANGRKLQSLSIEQVELACPTKVEYSIFVALNGSLWPNLKCLKVSWNKSSQFSSPHLFTCWQGLEKLDLDFQVIKSSDFSLFQEWLMGGVKYPENYVNGSVVVKSSDVQSLASCSPSKLVDLKNLRSLTLGFPKSFFMGDFLAFNCLQLMTNLHTLHLHGGIRLSDKAVNGMKTGLGETASVVVVKAAKEKKLQNDTASLVVVKHPNEKELQILQNYTGAFQVQVVSWTWEKIKHYWKDVLAMIIILIIFECVFRRSGVV